MENFIAISTGKNSLFKKRKYHNFKVTGDKMQFVCIFFHIC